MSKAINDILTDIHIENSCLKLQYYCIIEHMNEEMFDKYCTLKIIIFN